MDLRPATETDVPRIKELVDDAYSHYVERIGRTPWPMTLDYDEVVRDRDVTLAERDGEITGLLVVTPGDEGFLIENLAVAPAAQGTGIGRALLELAEAKAREAGYDLLYLFTHELMTENQELYGRIGYEEYARRNPIEGVTVVFMRKRLS